MELIKGKVPGAKKIIVYGPEGIGKSTFASKFPDPVFIDTEGSTKEMDVTRFEKPTSWQMLLEQIEYVKSHPDSCKTLVIDTIDWAETMCVEHVCAKHQKDGLESFGYGNGYIYVKEEFGRFLNKLEEVIQAGINVVLTAHAQMRKFEQPDELGAYDRYELKLGKKTSSQTSPLVKEWSDALLFANYKTIVVNVDGQGAQKGKNKVQGGKRVIYTTHHNCWDAKNRYGLPDEIPMDYEEIRSIIQTRIQTPRKEGERDLPAKQGAPEPAPADKGRQEPAKEGKADPPADRQPEPASPPEVKVDERVPKALRDLMIANGVDEWDIQAVTEAKGYVPPGTPIWEYEEVNPGFIRGVLVGAWGQVYAEIKEMKEKGGLVFN